MMKPYYKELPLHHVYDGNLTGTQKLLMFLLYIDNTYGIYDLCSLAKMCVEDVIFDLNGLKQQGYIKADEISK